MRRQKEKGAHQTDESEESENAVKTDPEEDATDDVEEGTLQTQTVSSIDATDSAELLSLHEAHLTTTLPPMETITVAMAEESTYTQIQRVPSPPKTIVESERLHLIEIKSDGTSGHLVRLPSGGYE